MSMSQAPPSGSHNRHPRDYHIIPIPGPPPAHTSSPKLGHPRAHYLHESHPFLRVHHHLLPGPSRHQLPHQPLSTNTSLHDIIPANPSLLLHLRPVPRLHSLRIYPPRWTDTSRNLTTLAWTLPLLVLLASLRQVSLVMRSLLVGMRCSSSFDNDGKTKRRRRDLRDGESGRIRIRRRRVLWRHQTLWT